MRIVLFGKNGQLGFYLHRTLTPLGKVYAYDLPEVDFTQPKTFIQSLRELEPSLIVNAAAYTAVDRAEKEPVIARAVNARAPGILAEEAKRLGSALIHYSTDYVFDGTSVKPYLEDDLPNPINTYGVTKLEGENAVVDVEGSYLIIRTSWVYSFRNPDCFPNRVLNWARSKEVLRIVKDQVGSPTWSRILAEYTTRALASLSNDLVTQLEELSGIYHLAGKGVASRFDFAKAILDNDPRKKEQVVREIQPALSKEFPSPADRPLYTPLNCDRFENTFGIELPDWKVALNLAVEEDA